MRSRPIPSDALKNPEAYQSFLRNQLPDAAVCEPDAPLEPIVRKRSSKGAPFHFTFRIPSRLAGEGQVSIVRAISPDEVMEPTSSPAVGRGADTTTVNPMTDNDCSAPLIVTEGPLPAKNGQRDNVAEIPCLVEVTHPMPSEPNHPPMITIAATKDVVYSSPMLPLMEEQNPLAVMETQNSRSCCALFKSSGDAPQSNEVVQTLLSAVEERVAESVARGVAPLSAIQQSLSRFETIAVMCEEHQTLSAVRVDAINEKIIFTAQQLEDHSQRLDAVDSLGMANARLAAEHSRTSELLEQRLEALTSLVKIAIERSEESQRHSLEATVAVLRQVV